MEQEKKVYNYVEKVTSEEIVHKVYLMMQSKIDDWYILLMNLNIVIDGLIKITEEDKINSLLKDDDFRSALDILKANIDIMKENKERMNQALEKK